MPRFYQYNELVASLPMPPSDILWLAGRISQLPAFSAGVAVLCGSVAWGQPSWRSDIDVVTFRMESFPDITPALNGVIKEYQISAKDRFLVPKVDRIIVGTESQHLVTRDNLVTGSMPITQMQTIREVFDATSLRFFDHIGSLAKTKGEPWRTFHASYLTQVSRDRPTRRDEIRAYVTSFADTWRQQPLRSLILDPSGDIDRSQLDAMGFAENFPTHLMRQVLAERGPYPSPDRASDVHTSFMRLSEGWAENLVRRLDPFLRIGDEYASIVDACIRNSPRISVDEYNGRLIKLFRDLPFADIEEAVWEYLSCTA